MERTIEKSFLGGVLNGSTLTAPPEFWCGLFFVAEKQTRRRNNAIDEKNNIAPRIFDFIADPPPQFVVMVVLVQGARRAGD
jgi:hypothetical protein